MAEEKNNIENTNNLLKEKLLKLLPAQGTKETHIGGMKIYRYEIANKIEKCFYIPIIVALLQGRKHSVVVSEKITYGVNECLVTGADLPISSYLMEVSQEQSLLSITLQAHVTLLVMKVLRNLTESIKNVW